MERAWPWTPHWQPMWQWESLRILQRAGNWIRSSKCSWIYRRSPESICAFRRTTNNASTCLRSRLLFDSTGNTRKGSGWGTWRDPSSSLRTASTWPRQPRGTYAGERLWRNNGLTTNSTKNTWRRFVSRSLIGRDTLVVVYFSRVKNQVRQFKPI